MVQGETTQATEFSQELSLKLVEALADVGGPPCGVITAQFGILKLDAIEIPSIFRANCLGSPRKHDINFPRRHPSLKPLKSGDPHSR